MPGLAPAGEVLSCYTTRKYPKKRTLRLAGYAGAFAPGNRIGRSGTPQQGFPSVIASLKQPDRTAPIRLPSAQRARRDTGQRCCPPLSPGPSPSGGEGFKPICYRPFGCLPLPWRERAGVRGECRRHSFPLLARRTQGESCGDVRLGCLSAASSKPAA
jgi:hypothetical protein